MTVYTSYSPSLLDLVPRRAPPHRPSSSTPSLSRATSTALICYRTRIPHLLSMPPSPGRSRLPPRSPSPSLSMLSWGDSPLSPLPRRHSLPSLDAFFMEDLLPCSPPPVPGPPGLADRIRGGSTSGDLFWSPDSQAGPSGQASSQPSPPPAPVGSEGMAVDFPPGIGDQSAWAISLKATEEGLGDNLSAAVRSLEYINTWLTWSVAQRRSVPDVDSDALASRILALSTNAISNGLFTAAAWRAPADSDLLFRIGSTVEELVNIPGVLAFTTASEALARAASHDKGKEKTWYS